MVYFFPATWPSFWNKHLLGPPFEIMSIIWARLSMHTLPSTETTFYTVHVTQFAKKYLFHTFYMAANSMVQILTPSTDKASFHLKWWPIKVALNMESFRQISLLKLWISKVQKMGQILCVKKVPFHKSGHIFCKHVTGLIAVNRISL